MSPQYRRTPNREPKPSTPTKQKPLIVGSSLGIYDTNSVRDRVRQWQAQGKGAITADHDHEDKAAAKDDTKDEFTSSTSSTRRLANPGTPNDRITYSDKDHSEPVEKEYNRHKNKHGSQTQGRDRSGSAPAKRVVSDAHWRKNRTPPHCTSSRTSLDGRRSANSKMEVADQGGNKRRPLQESKKSGKHRHREHRRASETSRQDLGDGALNDGIRVYRTSPTSQSRSLQASDSAAGRTEQQEEVEEKTSSISRHGQPATGSGEERPRSVSRNTLTVSSPGDPDKSRRRNERQRRRTPLDKAPRSNPVLNLDSFGSIKSVKGKKFKQILEESKKTNSKPQTAPIEAPRAPSIEAWLKGTTDPFVDLEHPPAERSPPPGTPKEQREADTEALPVDDPNKIWDTLESKKPARSGVHASRRSKRIPSSTIYEDNPFPESFSNASPLSDTPAGTVSASKMVDLVGDTLEVPPLSVEDRKSRPSRSSPPELRSEKVTRRNQVNLRDGNTSETLSGRTIPLVCSPDPTRPPCPRKLQRRPFPSTGRHRLSTIASVDTFNSKLSDSAAPSVSEISEATIQPSNVQLEDVAVESHDQFDASHVRRKRSRLTKHADLMSVLSMPKASSKSIMSARSIRTNRSRLATATTGDLLSELSNDEGKYMRELRTLVDGVIPVLLTCVLSKSDSVVAAGLFRPGSSTCEDPNFTKPIVEMGIALERLKTLHKRIPTNNVQSLLTWAQGAQRVYTEYLKAWRMGFQDVVVNLAPADNGDTHSKEARQKEHENMEEGLPINEDGDVVNGDGERVDVAFLLKRPLVRLKYLAKTLKGINLVEPSVEADALATRYQNLVITARNRSNEERARLEDEAAANIDPTRVRDLRTLAPLTGATVDRTRRVRARDQFNLALQHSSGQRIDCRVELLLRDEALEPATGGDLLICEVDTSDRWLLFPPVLFGRVSARTGDHKGEIVVMIRGLRGTGAEWQEVISLRSDDEQTGFDWVQMLGLTPVPPAVSRSQSFVVAHQQRKASSSRTNSAPEDPTISSSPLKSRTPSPCEIDLPIGEQLPELSKIWQETAFGASGAAPLEDSPSKSKSKLRGDFPDTGACRATRSPHNYVNEIDDLQSLPSQSSEKPKGVQGTVPRPRNFKEALGLTGSSSASLGLKRSRAKRLSKHNGSLLSPSLSRIPELREDKNRRPLATGDQGAREGQDASKQLAQAFTSHEITVNESSNDGKHGPVETQKRDPPSAHRSPSSVPSLNLPYIPRLRKNSPPATPIYEEDEEEPHWSSPPASKSPRTSPGRPQKQPAPASTRDEKSRERILDYRSPTSTEVKESAPPILNPSKSRPAQRRSSSPLKHEYEPSTASESSSDSDASTVEHNDVSSVSSSEDEEFEDDDAPTPLLPFDAPIRPLKVSPQGSLYSLPNETLKPSESASQAPYKKVPSQPTKASKTIASIFSWSDQGSWNSLHPDECSIVITPGLIEAFEMSAAHSSSEPLSSPIPVIDADAFSEMASNLTGQDEMLKNERPLVALGLTPLVPLRRGTAIDISIRSPPTANSQITSGNNIMFRSRNPEECEALYALINHSRINNPTYVALQNARGPFGGDHSLDRRASNRNGGSRMSSWFGGLAGSSGYRASSAPTPSIAPSESSIGSMSSAFSALKRFGRGGGGVFNIARSTISSRDGSRANSVYTSSDNSSGSGSSSPLPPGFPGYNHSPIGLSNAKIRLYIRETQSRWRDMGSARLTIMRPSPPNPASGESTLGDSVPRPTTGYQGSHEKRILVHGKTKGEVLLDAILGETCFERVGRQGIAVSVWEDIVGPNGEVGTVGAVGGVGAGRARVYMIQVSSLLSRLPIS